MLAQADAAGVDDARVRPAQVATREHWAVGSYEVAGVEGLAVGVNESSFGLLGDALDGVFPVKADAEVCGAIEQELVEDGATDAAAGISREGGFSCGFFGEEADSVKGVGLEAAEIFIEIDADGGEGLEGVGHEAFAAGFVDGRAYGLDDIDLEAEAGGGDGSGEAGGACSYDGDVRGICWCEVHFESCVLRCTVRRKEFGSTGK